MALYSPEYIRAHPVIVGMTWGVGFFVLYGVLLLFAGGSDLPKKLSTLAIGSFVGGLLFGYALKVIHDRKARR